MSTDRVAELEARVEQLRSALKPFAEAWQRSYDAAGGAQYPFIRRELAGNMLGVVDYETAEAALYDPQPQEPERL